MELSEKLEMLTNSNKADYIVNFNEYDEFGLSTLKGFNTVCKQLQKRAYGYKNFYNYRLKVLYACR